MGRGGVVVKDVNPAVVRSHAVEQGAHVVFGRDVSLSPDRRAALARDLLGEALCSLAVHVDDDDTRPLAAETMHRCAADPPGTAGNDRDLPVQACDQRSSSAYVGE